MVSIAVWAFVVLLVLGGLALVGVMICMLAIAVEARKIPHRPLHMRLNPFNVLADQRLWTPAIHFLNRIGVRLGIIWLACTLMAGLVRLGL